MGKHDGPSEAGYHFVQSYQNCKRKHYYTQILGLEPLYRSPAILFGTAVHTGLEEWYRQHKAGSSTSKKVKLGRDAALQSLDEHRHYYFDPTKAEVHRRQIIDTFQQYGLEYHEELFWVIAIEESLSHTLPSGDIFTGRLDLVTMQHDARIMIRDHKTTSWNMENVKRGLQVSDQASSYMMLWNKKNPTKRCAGVIFSIIRNYQGKTDFLQVPVYRTQKDIDLFEKEVTENLWDLAQRAIDPEATWPKNTDHCFSYNTACPFLELCQGSNFSGLIGVKFKQKELLSE